MEMPPQVIQANPRVSDDDGRVAVQRGPLVYCLEELDQPDGISLINVALELGNSPSEKFQSQLQADLLGGVVVLRHCRESLRKGCEPECAILPLRWSADEKPAGSVDLHSLLRLGQSAGDIDAGVESALQGLILRAIRKTKPVCSCSLEAHCSGTQLQFEGGGFAGAAP